MKRKAPFALSGFVAGLAVALGLYITLVPSLTSADWFLLFSFPVSWAMGGWFLGGWEQNLQKQGEINT